MAWKPIIAKTGVNPSDAQAPTLLATDLAPDGALGQILSVEPASGAGLGDGSVYWNNFYSHYAAVITNDNAAIGGEWNVGSGEWEQDTSSDSLIDFSNMDTVSFKHATVPLGDATLTETEYGSGNYRVSAFQNSLTVLDTFSINLTSNEFGHATHAYANVITRNLTISDLDSAGEVGTPLDCNANLYDHFSYGPPASYALEWVPPAPSPFSFTVLNNVEIHINNTSANHPQNVSDIITDAYGAVLMNGTTAAPYLFQADPVDQHIDPSLLVSGPALHASGDHLLYAAGETIDIWDLVFSTSAAALSFDCDYPDPATDPSDAEAVCANNLLASAGGPNFTQTVKYTGDLAADFYRSWGILDGGNLTGGGGSTLSSIGSSSGFQRTSIAATVEDELNLVGSSLPASLDMDSPVTTSKDISITFSNGNAIIDPVSGSAVSGNVPLITIAGTYGDNARIRDLSSGDALSFVDLDSGTGNLYGAVSLAAPFSIDSLSTNSVSDVTGVSGHTHQIISTDDGSTNRNTVLRTDADGAITVQDLDVKGSLWDGSGGVVFVNANSAIADSVLQLNTMYTALEAPYCTDGSYLAYASCLQAAGTCSCADGGGSCALGADLSGYDYATCEGADATNWLGYGDGTGGNAAGVEWIPTHSWVTHELDDYGDFPPVSELGDIPAIGTIFGHSTPANGGVTYIGGYSSKPGSFPGDSGSSSYPVLFKDLSLAYKGLELGEVAWQSSGVLSPGAGMDYTALFARGTKPIVGFTDHYASDGVLTLYKEGFGSDAANAGNLVLAPNDVIENQNYYNGIEVPNQPIVTGAAHNSALALGSPATAEAYDVVPNSGGYLECSTLSLGDVGNIATSADVAYKIDTLSDELQHGMLVATHGTGGALFLLHNDS